MRWFRTNRGSFGALALFALALQITLSFGHIHLRDFAGIPGVAAAQAQAGSADPADGGSSRHSTDDYCLVCSTVNLAGTLVLPDVAAPLAPVGSTAAAYVYFCAASCGRVDHALFHARAPPLA
jgi:hypothetical protein